MNDLFDLRPTNKEVAFGILGVFVLLVVVFSIGYCIGLRNAGTDVSDNGKRIEDVRNELSTAIQHQHEITAGLESAVGRSNSIEARSDRIEKAAGAAAKSVGEAGVLIDQCQQIIGTVRNRGKTGAVKN